MSSTFYDRFFSEPMAERQRIAEAAGLSLAYIQKHTYVQGRSPRFHFHNAVGLDRASNGKLSFIDTTEGGIDWAYVLDRLKQLQRAGVIANKKAAPLATVHFDRFWAAYPRKVAKVSALRSWIAQGADVHADAILKDIARRQPDWTDAKYIPHPTTYLNQRRWEDEVSNVAPGQEVFAGAL